ncbi:hypothetical protein [Streptomyces rubiginosohelvolus]|uniref:hypothetical protein n=1 Tax=Streptomyces rubiginosohelvolus TaxID=67362 RepID=UPI00369CC97F
MTPGVENGTGNATPENPTPENGQETPALRGDIPSTDGSSGNREAAKYRTKLREAEGKLEAAEARITALLRREIEAHAGKTLAVGADLFDIGKVNVDDLTDPEGNVMPDAVDVAIEALLATRPGLSNRNRPWGDVGGGRHELPERAPTMHDALRYKGH